MKKSLIVINGIFLCLLITGLIIFSQENYSNSTQDMVSNDYSVVFRSKALIPHDPIIIDNNADFVSYGFPGNGSSTNPYLVSGYSIITSENPDGIVIEGTTKYFRITNCYIEVNNEGIRVKDIAYGNAVIANNQFKACAGDAIVVNNADCTIIANNTGFEDHVGLRIHNSEDVFAYNNTFIGGSPTSYICSAGIYPSDCFNVTLLNNTIDDFNRGIYTKGTTYSIIINNTILSSKEYGGIYLNDDSDYNLIINNTVLENSSNEGIRLWRSSYNEICYNTVMDNNAFGCTLQEYSSYNYIHHNNFINNIQANPDLSQGYEYNSENNYWYQISSEKGNYWSDWDEINPYVIFDSANFDLYPLYSPTVMNWSDFRFKITYDDILEDNDCLEDAKNIPLNNQIDLVYNDRDFFRFTLDDNYTITVTIYYSIYAEIDLDLFLLPSNYSGSIEEILASGESTSAPETITYTNLIKGSYYLLVESKDVFSKLEFYSLIITLSKPTIIFSFPNYFWILTAFITTFCITTIITKKRNNYN